MRYWRAILHYYWSQLPAGLALSALTYIFIDALWAIVVFILLGSLFGKLAFSTFYKEQLLYYHNLGFTKARLITLAFYLNLILTLVLASIIAGIAALLL
ncbi:hypothetical protein [Gilvibacter sp.]|uniref:hypothetical protein n=1 Tax=Gilvibacter sp. TaxID=2729997 RepID=UPI003B52C751